MKLKRFNEHLSESSKNDLVRLKEALGFVSEYDIELYEAIDVIDKLLKMDWEEIEEWREHLETNESRIDIDDFTIRLINSYCSNIDQYL